MFVIQMLWLSMFSFFGFDVGWTGLAGCLVLAFAVGTLSIT
jgi:hypothetical protein